MKTATQPRPEIKTAKPAANDNAGGRASSATQNKSNQEAKSEDRKETPFEKLFMDLLKDMYWAEQHLVKALSKMSEAATTEQLRDAFEDHLYVTKKHVSRLERVFSSLGKPAQSKKCAAMEGLVAEAEEIIKSTEEGSMTRDAGLIIAAQKVEHYEIASYGSLMQVALTLGYDEAAHLFEKTLFDEENTDRQLTAIAESDVNPLADQDKNEGEEKETRNEEED